MMRNHLINYHEGIGTSHLPLFTFDHFFLSHLFPTVGLSFFPLKWQEWFSGHENSGKTILKDTENGYFQLFFFKRQFLKFC